MAEDVSASQDSPTEELRRHIFNMKKETFSSEKIIDLIKDKGADPNVKITDDGETPLMYLSLGTQGETSGLFHDEVMKAYQFLLELPSADINAQNKDGDRLIHFAVCMRDPTFLENLLNNREESRLHINTMISGGLPPLHQACFCERASIRHIAILLAHGADPNQRSDPRNYTPLHCAIIKHLSIPDVPLLIGTLDKVLEHGADIGNTRDHHGRTAMHLAAKCVHSAEFFIKLLDHGGIKSLDIRCFDGRTPLEEAELFLNFTAIGAIERYNEMINLIKRRRRRQPA